MWVLLVIASPFALYGLHRLCLRLEERGYLYYWRKKPEGGASPLIGLEVFVQPQARHVIEAQDHSPEKADDDRYLPGKLHPARPDEREKEQTRFRAPIEE